MSTAIPTPQPDLEMVKQRQQQMWSAGDYSEVGSRLVIMSELLCEAVDPQPGDRVLDVASGTGNAALAAARRFCDVTSSDYVPELLECGKARAEAEGLPIRFEIADAENLPYPDASFDVVLSAIGVMFAPNQQRAAQELLRVCRPAGKIGLASWTPDSFTSEMYRTAVSFAPPPPPGMQPPDLWGTEEYINTLLGDESSSLETRRRHITLCFHSLEHFIDFTRTNLGPVATVYGILEPERQDALTNALRERVNAHNRSGNDRVVIDAGYLEIVAVKA